MLNNVVVITGASGGLGRQTAVEFAKKGAVVILAARRHDSLEETAALCRAAGATAICVVTDVTREEQVRHLADVAWEQFGRLDVWVNNAGVTVFAPLEGEPFETHQRVIETNLYGAMFGARAAIPIFRKQKRGVLINVGSLLGKIGQPFVPSYVISKFALRGLTEALRAELADEDGIHVCSIFAYAIDTPHFQTGSNHFHRETHAMPPVQSPEKVARAIVRLAERPRRESHVPRAAVLGLALHALLPRTVERLVFRALSQWHFSDVPAVAGSGNLFFATEEAGQVHGQRRPQLSGWQFAAWLARELFKMEGQQGRRMVKDWSLRARNMPANANGGPVTSAVRVAP
jgi:NAD(P)-dependent dehydrogenase (short-subunit alcohol dehydrogenase family)